MAQGEMAVLAEKYREAMTKGEAIRQKSNGIPGPMPAEDRQAWEGYLTEAEGYKAQMAVLKRSGVLFEWEQQGQNGLPGLSGGAASAEAEGKSAAEMAEVKKKSIVSGRAFGVKERTGKSWDRGFKGRMDHDLLRKVSATESEGYRDALESLMRYGSYQTLAIGSPLEAKALAEAVDSSGGFLVPEDFRADVIQKMPGFTALRDLVASITTSRDIVRWPRVAYTSDDIYTSGVRVGFFGEIPASATAAEVADPLLGQEAIPVHTGMLSIKLSNDLVEDAAFDVDSFIRDKFNEAYNLGLDNYYLNGTGIGQPEGLLSTASANAIGTVKSGSNGAFASSNPGDAIIGLYYAVPAQYRAKAQWVMSSLTAMAVRSFKDANGRYLWDSLVGSGLMTSGDQDSLLGRPVKIDEFMPAYNVSQNIAMLFGDFSGYMEVQRIGMAVQVLTELYAEFNQVKILGRFRVGGGIIEPWKIKAMLMSS